MKLRTWSFQHQHQRQVNLFLFRRLFSLGHVFMYEVRN